MDPIVASAARKFVDAALAADDSIFTPGETIWTLEHLDDFRARFVEHPNESSDSFTEKLKGQLAGAGSGVAQAVGELLFVHLLATRSMGAAKKREVIEAALQTAPTPVEIPSDLLTALETGMAYSGQGLLSHRYYMLKFLLEFALEWKRLPEESRAAALADPWRFKHLLFDLDCYKAGSQREALLHFVHPDYFEPMTSKKDKDRIVETFADVAGERYEDRDRQIFAIRESLEKQYGKGMDFYDPELVAIWKPYASWSQFVFWARKIYKWSGFEDAERNYKLKFAADLAAVRRLVEGDAKAWIEELKRTIGAVNISQWRANTRLIEWCREEPERARQALHLLWNGKSDTASRLGTFTEAWGDPNRGSRIRTAAMLLMAGDPTRNPPFAIRTFERAFVLTGHTPPAKDANDATIYEHALGFLDRFVEEAARLGLEIKDRLEAQSLVWALVHWKEDSEPFIGWPASEQAALQAFRKAPEPDNGDNGNGPPPPPPRTDPLALLADELLLDRSFFATAKQLLRDKGQIIFYGPPGTGKTFVARRLAETLAGSRDRVRLVQFHPSYAYEDFIEGFRPSDGSGGSGFALVSGPLIRIADEARKHPEDQYVLVIDEINRGNVAKVFGELYFLLEYRDEAIDLQYSRDAFSLPKNLWIIGTMNTADRSIALMDAALRRRFYFLPFFPSERPVQGLLRRWLERHQPSMIWVADALDRANRELNDRHFAIGPSYFLKRDLNRQWVETIWEHSVLPYLAERYFGAEDQLERFRLQALLDETDPDADEEGESIEEDPSEDSARA